MLECVFFVGRTQIDFQELKENRDKLQITSNEIKFKYRKFIQMIDDFEIYFNNELELYQTGANPNR